MSNLVRKISIKHIFTFYIVLLIDIVIFKFYGHLRPIIDRVQTVLINRNAGCWNINLSPFREIRSSATSFMLDFRLGITSITVLANVIVFIPLGILLPLLMVKPSFLKTICMSLLIVLGIEIIQFVSCLGYFDVDDIILNMVGSIIGYASLFVFKKIREGH